MFNKDKLTGKRIALIGGAGFIGHHLALKLKELGAEPHVVDGLQVNSLGFYASAYNDNPHAETYLAMIDERLALLRQAKIKLYVVDVRDYHTVTTTLTSIKPDAIIHLAAVAHANRSNKDPFSTFDHSLRTLENVLDIARSWGTHIVYFSSSMVYGDFQGKAVTEDSVCKPLGIYGALKYSAEKIVIGYNQVFNLPYTIIRPSALYGQRCVSRRVGQAFIENALVGEDLTVNGDGSDALDFTYIEDLLQGVILCITEPAAKNQIFNLTFGEGVEIKEMAQIVLDSFPGLKLVYKPRDSLMPERGALSIDKAKTLIGYCPKYPLAEGFSRYISWYRKFSKENPGKFAESTKKLAL